MEDKIIVLGHGSGGRLTRELISDLFLSAFGQKDLAVMSDSAILPSSPNHIAFTTDSYVIDPIFFPGGDIGKLAISGTVNDLAVSGAIPKYISMACIIEEGFSISDLKRIATSMATEAQNAGVTIVTGDTKVVKRGQCDKIFITTSGIGFVPENRKHIASGNSIHSGDKVIVSGYLGDHAMAILAAREKLSFEKMLLSDVAPLNSLIDSISKVWEHIHFMRDITRGGLATVLVEICENKKFGIEINESKLPIRKEVTAICELYGFDPLYLANEGKIVIIASEEVSEFIVNQLKSHPLGDKAAIIGEITDSNPEMVILKSRVGGKRIIDMLSGEMLPRIC